MVSTKVTNLRIKLNTKIFIPYGKSVTFKKRNSPTYNSRGELNTPTYASTTQIIVPYNIIDKKQTFEAFGALEEGDMDAAVPYTVNVAIDDKFTIESEDWIVKAVERNYLPENVVTIIRLALEQN